MDKNGFIAVISILVIVSATCNASLDFHPRKLVATENINASTAPQVTPAGSPEKSIQDKPEELLLGNTTNNNTTLPNDSEGSSNPGNDTKTVVAPSPLVVEKNNSTVGRGDGKDNVTTTNLGNNDSCDGSLVNCRDKEMIACIEAPKDASKDMFLVVKNEGEITLKVNVQIPNDLMNDFPAFDVPKHETRRIDVSSTKGKSTELIINSGNAKCVLPLVKSVSVDSIIHQLSFYSKQVTPIYAAYASFLVAILLGGMWACCRLRKRSQENGIPYQELEMGLPESSPAVNVDVEEGWDDDWGDDWDENSAAKSPSVRQGRSVSANGLVSVASKKDGWDNDWDD